MAGSPSIETIIRQECLPLRDCMLTVTDDHGEAAFLYFKEGELIEANYAALWGKDALGQIVTWTLAEHTVAPLPLGIKRSLWDQIEYLLNPGSAPTASGRIPVGPSFSSSRKSSSSSPFDRFRAISGLLKLVQLSGGKEAIIQDAGPDQGESEKTEWLLEFVDRLKSVGDTLGFGNCEKWTIETERFQVVGLRQDDGYIAMLRRKDAAFDDLETAVEAVLEGD